VIKNPDRILFRTGAGPQVGFGHLRRCLSLADAFVHYGAQCRFVCHGSAENIRIIERSGHAAIVLKAEPNSPEDLRETSAAVASFGAGAAVVDDYCVEYFGGLSKTGAAIVALDDLATRSFAACDVVVSSGAHAGTLPYPRASNTLFLLGPVYVPLRPEVWDVAPRQIAGDVRHVLVTLGGADPVNVGPVLLSALDAIAADFAITFVSGPFAHNQAQVKRLATGAQHRVEVLDAPADLVKLMRAADLAICAAGQTIYELAALGTPAIAIVVVENQVQHAAAFAEQNVIESFAWDPTRVAAVQTSILTLMGDVGRRRAMSAAGQRAVDGRGALRVARTVLDKIAGCNRESRSFRRSSGQGFTKNTE
jgi:UDP-2,4-diacetamido-2,4,6-trideoxy-beta-L-altropyranose hydrolase